MNQRFEHDIKGDMHMDTSTLVCNTNRRARWIAPLLLSIAVAGCGGDWSVAFSSGGHHDHHHHRGHDEGPPDHQSADPPADAGLFLFAGDVCHCAGSADGTGPAARFDNPEGIAADSSGNLYLAERNSSTIRKITPQAVATTLAGVAGAAGSIDGTGAGARFNNPTRVRADRDGNLYVTDTGNSTIRKVSPQGAVATLAGNGVCGSADGPGTAAQFCAPQGIALDPHGNLFVTDTLNHTVRKIDAAGAVTTVAGTPGVCGSADGRGRAAQFCGPRDIAADSEGNLFVADTANSTIRLITPDGEVRTVAGRANECGFADGSGNASRLCKPGAIDVDASGELYVADTGNSAIRRIVAPGTTSTVAGVAGSNAVVLGPLPGGLDAPSGVAISGSGSVAVTSNNLVLKLVLP